MYDHLEPTNIPEPGPAELAAVKQRAAARQRNIFLLGASSGAGLVAIIALIVVALVSAGSNTKDVNTVGRPETTTTIAPAPSTTVPPPGQPPAAAPGPATARRRGIRSTPAPAPSTTAHGSLVAFVAQNRSDEIDVVNLDGTARRTLWTHPIADHTSLTLGSWSPDGRLLAVTTHFAALGGGGSVYLIDPQGQVVRRWIGPISSDRLLTLIAQVAPEQKGALPEGGIP